MGGEGAGSLAAGSSLGHYVVGCKLGAGGMGEVYEAEDTRLHRRVAVKVVRGDLVADPARRKRLEHEAVAAAALNHPNVVTVHALEQHADRVFLSMELIDGKTLDETLPAGGFPLDRLLWLATQLTDALCAAHAAGVVHRDLKPSNVMVTRDDHLKVLDFGLSRRVVEGTATSESTDLLAAEGMLAGTTPYMSPEQITGHAADERSDIFALGVLLFEMVTGRRPFSGATQLATLTAIASETPARAGDLDPAVPEELSWVIDRCLDKDPARRLQSAVDLRALLERIGSTSGLNVRQLPVPVSQRQRPAHRHWTLPAAATLSIAVVVLAGIVIWRAAVPADAGGARVTQFTVELPDGHVMYSGFNPQLAFSSDGSVLAFTPLPGPVYVRYLDELEVRALDATVGPDWHDAPLFSPDGTHVAFIEGNAIASSVRPFYRLALSGGAPLKLADYDAFHRGSWSDDGWIYWTAEYPGGIVRIPEGGGETEPVTELDLARGERSHRFASLLPGPSPAMLFTVAAQGMRSYDEAYIDLWDPVSRQRTRLVTGGTSPVYAPSGHIVYARGGKLLAVPFDLKRRRVTGTPFEALGGVMMSSNTGAAQFGLSSRGDLAYVPGAAEGGGRRLVWVNRDGHEEPLPLPPAPYLYPRLSPDGRSVAVEIEGPNHDLYIYDLERAVLAKMTTDGHSHAPVWSPDGTELAFRSWIGGGMTLWRMRTDRSAAASRLGPAGARQSPVSFSPDGRLLSFDQKSPASSDDVWVLPLADGASPVPVAQSHSSEGSGKFSPDGRWIAFASDESGTTEVYVQAFPGPGPKIQISSDGGFDPVWRRSGGELYYRTDGAMIAVAIETSPTLRASAPRLLWKGRYSHGTGSSCGMPGPASTNYDVTADGQRFLMVRDDDQWIADNKVIVLTNWADGLKRKARAAAARASEGPAS